MTRSVVVTGSSGFIGSALVEKVKQSFGYKIVPVCRSSIDSVYINVSDYRDTPSGDILIHLAEDPDRGHVNSLGTRYVEESGAVLCALLTKGFEKVIYCSSATIYGDKGTIPYSEDSSVHAVDTYVTAKLENERRVLAASGVVVRISNVIGAQMASNNVISDILKQLPDRNPILVRNDKPICDFVWLDDVIDGLMTLINHGESGVYNIGSGQGTSIRELARIILNIKGQQARMIQSEAIGPPYSFNVLNLNKMKQMYGWTPSKNIYQCLEQLIITG